MSSAAGLFDMRYSGSSFANAFLAGSSDGKTLSVMAINGRGMAALSQRKNLGIDAVRQLMPADECQDIIGHDLGHGLSHFGRGAAEMGRQHHIGQFFQSG